MKIADSLKVERPLGELSSIEIVDILSSVMLVRYKKTSELYIIKVIRKNSLSRNELPILPLSLPFMVKLYKYFCTENSIYVLLQYARGGMLWNYFKNRKSSISSKDVPDTINENDVEDSYKDLINDYCSKQKNDDTSNENTNNNLELEDNHEPEIPDDTKNLLKNAQELLESVSDLLEKNKQLKPPVNETVDISNLEFLESRKVDIEFVDCWSEECIMQWPRVSESTVIMFASQLVVALESLHRLGIVCYDLQPKNLLLDEKGNLLLSYMYYWENIEVSRCPEYPAVMYTAPELSTISPVTKAVDWWSFGVILYEMLTSLNFYKCHPGIFSPNTVLNIPKFVSPVAESLLTQLLVHCPEERLGYGLNGAENIKAHPFFAEVNWRQLGQRS
ncbi:ribosomal protein S6 kinase delta-1 [Chrysoperla carnea]|uniref:ribosomal protein S6 kinase delta-1 n=1 Tax=Chrysoperla carnea TaxID=189513 RepID=UPI001D078DA6|nr:ribosomal protein S6 kinase delta-1 [Chrysoperla carnea]